MFLAPILVSFASLGAVANEPGDRTKVCEGALVNAKLRVARATNDLQAIAKMYKEGLGLSVLCEFADHCGFDGIMLGAPGLQYHFEFTQQTGFVAPRSPSAESLLVFYLPDLQEWERVKGQMIRAGFRSVTPHNPYWEENGITFEDPEGYRVVLCRNCWGE